MQHLGQLPTAQGSQAGRCTGLISPCVYTYVSYSLGIIHLLLVQAIQLHFDTFDVRTTLGTRGSFVTIQEARTANCIVAARFQLSYFKRKDLFLKLE